PHLSVQLRVALEEQCERVEAAHDVLRRVDPIDAHDDPLRAASSQCRFSLEYGWIVSKPVELGRIDADRSRDDACLAAAVLDDPATRVHVCAEQPLHGEKEGSPPALRVETD